MGETQGRNGLGWTLFWEAHLDKIDSRYRQAKEKLLQITITLEEDRYLTADHIQALGEAHQMLSEYSQARQHYEEALPLYRDIGARLGEANTIRAPGEVHQRLDEYEQARRQHEEAIMIYRRIGARLGEMNALAGLADLDRYAEEWKTAQQKYLQILQFELESGLRLNAAVTYRSLGHTARGMGNAAEARRYYQAAIDLFEQIRSPEAHSVREDLKKLDSE